VTQENKERIDNLLHRLISKLDTRTYRTPKNSNYWEDNEEYYIETLFPNYIKGNYSKITSEEKDILGELKPLLVDEWDKLPDILLKAGREHIKKAAKDQREEKEQEEKLDRLKKQILKAEEHLKEIFEKDFLKADALYSKNYHSLITNDKYYKLKSSFVKKWFKNEIDDEQAAAISLTNTNALIDACAGSGKTLTLINKAIFLIDHCKINADNILILAFNTDAVENIKTPLNKSLHEKKAPHIRTFHSLAYALTQPKEKLLADSEYSNNLKRAIEQILKKYLNKQNAPRVRKLMLDHFKGDWEKIEIALAEKDSTRYKELKALRESHTMGIDSCMYKSKGEKRIADFLFEHNVLYEYEKSFYYDGGIYRPDFYIENKNGTNIIIEYFGIVNNPKYNKEKKKKQNYWKHKNNYELISLEYEEGVEESFKEKIKTILKNKNIECEILYESELIKKIETRLDTRFQKTISSFIKRRRQENLSLEGLRDKTAKHTAISKLEEAFLYIAQEIYSLYLYHLSEEDKDDFEGLMYRASDKVRNGQTRFKSKGESGDISNLEYIFIDEFQDFSKPFYSLINSIKKTNTEVNIFAVGDSWQAINGFAGASLNYFKNFSDYFNQPIIKKISTNYRSCKDVVDIGNKLMESTHDDKKAIAYNKNTPGGVIQFNINKFCPSQIERYRNKGDFKKAAILRLIGHNIEHGRNITILSRNKHSHTDIGDMVRSHFSKENQQKINISTIHKYKGLQNDTIILIDAIDRDHPFIHIDSIFLRIFGDNIVSIVSEAKRLFYVACSRAINHLILITSDFEKSRFIDNLNIDEENWNNLIYKAPYNKDQIFLIKIINPESCNSKKPHTMQIKEALKKQNYFWNSHEEAWERVSTVTTLEEARKEIEAESWTATSPQITVLIYKEGDGKDRVAEYNIKEGNWTLTKSSC